MKAATKKKKWMGRLRMLAVYLILGGLLWWATRNVPLIDIWTSIRQLQGLQIMLLLAINALVIGLMTARWWFIVRAENPRVPYLPMVGYRLSAFGLSYFTPGPQVGGEPLQVIYLQKYHHLSYARATAAVIMDKLLEFLINFVLLALGAWAVIQVGLFETSSGSPIAGLASLGILLAWPLIHILLLYYGHLPISKLLRAQPFFPTASKGMRLIFVSERMAAAFCRRHLPALLASAGVSLLAVTGILIEYVLMLEFLGMHLSALQVLAGLTALQLAFLMPLPGGLGAMEASQVFALGFFGQPASAAIAMTLLQRARDLLNGGVGLVLAGTLFNTSRDENFRD
jgi:glycosyltransferase 2 family protein